jgi:hypothetical protein
LPDARLGFSVGFMRWRSIQFGGRLMMRFDKEPIRDVALPQCFSSHDLCSHRPVQPPFHATHSTPLACSGVRLVIQPERETHARRPAAGRCDGS